MSTAPTPLRVHVDDRIGDVGALKLRPRNAEAALVLAHGAGAGMTHPFMEAIATELARLGIATLRYQFPYMEAGKGRPDHRSRLLATVGASLTLARRTFRGLPLFAGGKSMGGRMTSQWIAARHDGDAIPVNGLVFFGFPLHPAGKPGVERADHLRDFALPMLFHQGTRDGLADSELIARVCADLGARATMHVIDGADHGFHVLRRSGRTDDEILHQLAVRTADWVRNRTS